jgi:hypothetical protein
MSRFDSTASFKFRGRRERTALAQEVGPSSPIQPSRHTYPFKLLAIVFMASFAPYRQFVRY